MTFLRRLVGNALVWLEEAKGEARVARCKLTPYELEREFAKEVTVKIVLDSKEFDVNLNRLQERMREMKSTARWPRA